LAQGKGEDPCGIMGSQRGPYRDFSKSLLSIFNKREREGRAADKISSFGAVNPRLAKIPRAEELPTIHSKIEQ
jgi:hypothetical protein